MSKKATELQWSRMQVMDWLDDALSHGASVLLIKAVPCNDETCPNYGEPIHAVEGITNDPKAAYLAELYLHPDGES